MASQYPPAFPSGWRVYVIEHLGVDPGEAVKVGRYRMARFVDVEVERPGEPHITVKFRLEPTRGYVAYSLRSGSRDGLTASSLAGLRLALLAEFAWMVGAVTDDDERGRVFDYENPPIDPPPGGT